MPDRNDADYRRDQMRQAVQRVWAADVGQRAPYVPPPSPAVAAEGRVRAPAPPNYAKPASHPTAAELARRYRAGDLSPVEVARQALARAEAEQPRLNAFISLLPEQALALARESENRWRQGQPLGPLDGVPVGIKDIIDVAGARTTAASKLLRDNVAAADSPVASRLRAGGAVFLGKTNLHEFAYGGTGDSGHFGPARNPHDPERLAGGSSSGSAVAVAAGLCPVALGTDTAGSIRIPAAVCGIVGLKPTYGRVPTSGVIPLSWSLDHVGPMAGTVEDAALALAAMCDFEAPSFDRAVSDFRVGICRTQFFEHLDAEVRPRVEDALAGLQVQELQLPHLAEGLAAQQVITAAEAAAYHHRWLESQLEAYDPAVRARLDAARNVDGADYVQALRVRGLAAEEMAAALQQVDVLASPTVPIPAPRFDAVEVEVEDGRLTVLGAMIRNTAAANVSGFPAISLPCGSTAAGLPVGVQLIGRPWQEGRLLEIARWFEERLPA